MKKIGLGLVLTAGLIFGANYQISENSIAKFEVKHMMINTVHGSFNHLHGNVEIEDGELKHLNGIIYVESINTENDKRDDHLRASDILDVANYPYIEFKSTSIEGETLKGELTIKDISKEVSLNVEKSGLGFILTGSINRSEFGVVYNKILETGGVSIGDELKLNIFIEADEEGLNVHQHAHN